MELIDREETIKVLQELKKKREECGCRGGRYEATALQYAIEIMKKQQVHEIPTR